MFPMLLSLVLLGQAESLAPPKVITPDQWRSFADYHPSYEFLCHWDARTRTWPYSSYRKKASAGTAPAAIDYGVTLRADHPAAGEVRGTDNALARELAQLSLAAGQPCPGPGPCPNPRPKLPDPPDPFAPDEPPSLTVNLAPLIVAGGLVALSLLLALLTIVTLAVRKAHP
jgi:hypothetical protein